MSLQLKTLASGGGGGGGGVGADHDHIGGDGAPITEEALSLSDVTTLDATTTRHGFCPKGTGTGTSYLRDDLTWQTVAGGQTLFECVVAPSGGDYTTLGAALAAGKKRIFIRNGTYNETGEPVIPSDSVIVGESRDGVKINVSGTTNHRIAIANDACYIEIRNLYIYDDAAQDWLLETQSTSSTHQQILIENCYFYYGGINLNTSYSLQEIKIRGNRFYNGGGATYGAIKLSSSSASILYAHITDNIIEAGSLGANYKVISCSGNRAFGLIISRNCISGGRYTNGTTVYAIYCYFSSTSNPHYFLITDNIFTEFYGNYQIYAYFAFTGLPDGNKGIIANNTLKGGGATNAYIYVSSPFTLITGNQIQIGSNTGYGVQLASLSKYCAVIGNLFGAGASAGPTTAIYIESGADNCVVQANSYGGAAFSTLISDSGANTYFDEDHALAASDVKKYVRMKNTSGVALSAGQVVILKSVASGNEVTTTTTAGDPKVFGMAIETINDNAWGRILIKGKTTQLKVNGTDAIAIGDFLSTYSEAGIAKKASAGEMAFAIALEAYAQPDSNGVIDALLIEPKKI